MSNLQVKLSRLASRKVPALSLILVAITGMAIGVFAATITVSTTNSFGGEQGILHNNTGVLTIVDNGLSVVSNVPTGGSAPNASSTFLLTGNKNSFSNAQTFTVGHWEESLTITDTVGTDTTAHAVKITINSGAAVPSGSALIAQVTYTMTGINGSTNPTITLYIDLATSGPITPPLNIYVTSN